MGKSMVVQELFEVNFEGISVIWKGNLYDLGERREGNYSLGDSLGM